MKAKLHKFGDVYTFFCPGCRHIITINDTWKIDMEAGIPVGSTVPRRMMSNMAMNILEKGARLECDLPKSIIQRHT